MEKGGGRWVAGGSKMMKYAVFLSKSLVILIFFEWFSLQRNDVLVSEKHRISLGKILFSTAENIVF